MRILLLHPNYHSGGAEIAGNWPPAWVAYLYGALKSHGYPNVHFIDAMTNDLGDEELERRLRAEPPPDIIGCTAITPSIYKAQSTLALARKVWPKAVTVLGGIHATFMYQQVLAEAPHIDYIVRGEGEEVLVNLVRAVEGGRLPAERGSLRGIAYRDGDRIVATAAHDPISALDSLTPDWSILEWSKYIYIPLNTRVAIPNFARGCPFTCSFCSQWKFWRTYHTRSPKNFVDEIERLVKDHQVGFFILADEEPTINRDKFIALCQELIDRKIGIPWAINTRVTDILRDEDMLPFYRKAGLVHISLGTEASAQLMLERFRKETTIADNKKAIRLIREAGMVAEAQFIIGLENETPETIEDTFKWAMDWNADMVNWNMYTPWPFSDLFAELGDKVEVRDYAKYNFVTPIMKPDQMTRSDVLNGVMKNYKRFYMRKSFFSYPWIRDSFKRKYMLGCLRAFFKSTIERRFYDLGRIGYRGQKEVDFKFDPSKVLSPEQLVQLQAKGRAEAGANGGAEGKARDERKPAVSAGAMACGGGPATGAHLQASVAAASRPADPSAPAEAAGQIDAFFDPRGFARQRAQAAARATPPAAGAEPVRQEDASGPPLS